MRTVTRSTWGHRLLPAWWALGAALCLVLLLLPAAAARAQGGTTEQQRVLDVRRQQLRLRDGQAELARTEELFNQGLASQAQLDRATSALEEMQLAYQESLLSLLSLQPRLTVDKAVRSQDEAGRRFVRLTVANLTPAFDDRQLRLLNDFEGAEPIPAELRTRTLRDIFVSLQSLGGDGVQRGTTIGLPYEMHIPELAYGDRRTLTFQMLRDVSEVVVVSSFLGQKQELAIQLQLEDFASGLNISSTQISQEADLGSQLAYALSFERSTVDVREFSVTTLGLPRQISSSYVEPETGARLSQLSFPAGVRSQSLELRLFLPERADEQVAIDRPMEFWAVAAESGSLGTLGPDATPEQLEAEGAGLFRLVLTPRGIGKIEVSALSLFEEIEASGRAESILTIANTGTRRLEDVWLRADAPAGWRIAFEPERLAGLEVRQEASATMTIEPLAGAPAGDYEVRIKTESTAYNRRVPSEDKVFRVRIRPETNILTTAILLGGLAALLLGGIWLAIKVTRR